MGRAGCNLREHPRVTFRSALRLPALLLSLPHFTKAIPAQNPLSFCLPFCSGQNPPIFLIPGTSVDRPQSHLPYFLPGIRPCYRCSVAACIWALGLCGAPRWGRGADVAAKCRPRPLNPWRRRGHLGLAAPADRIRRRRSSLAPLRASTTDSKAEHVSRDTRKTNSSFLGWEESALGQERASKPSLASYPRAFSPSV